MSYLGTVVLIAGTSAHNGSCPGTVVLIAGTPVHNGSCLGTVVLIAGTSAHNGQHLVIGGLLNDISRYYPQSYLHLRNQNIKSQLLTDVRIFFGGGHEHSCHISHMMFKKP